MKCSFIKPDGSRCKGSAVGQQGLCWAHDPANAEMRQRTAARGGRGKAAKKIHDLYAQVERDIADVRSGKLTHNQGFALRGLFDVLISLERLRIEQAELEIAERRLELDVEERVELRQQLEDLEEALEEKKGRRYGAQG